MKEDKRQNIEEAEKRLELLYRELADLVPEALADDFVGKGYAKGKYYDQAKVRLLMVEKIPRAQAPGGGEEWDFSGVASRVAGAMLGIESGAWTDHVAWSYLYKLAPREGRPDQAVYQKQKELCGKIIKEEIRLLAPDYVLFFTGWGKVWDFDLPLTPLLKGGAVEAWGRTEEDARLLVTRYAVRKPEEAFIAEILEKIKLLGE